MYSETSHRYVYLVIAGAIRPRTHFYKCKAASFVVGLADKKRFKALRSLETKDTKGIHFVTAEELKVKTIVFFSYPDWVTIQEIRILLFSM